MYLIRIKNELILIIGEFLGNRFVKSEDVISRQDYKCFNCVHFIGCSCAGDIICNKENTILKYRGVNTVRACNKNSWYVRNEKEMKSGDLFNDR